jgi:hypothetical protein
VQGGQKTDENLATIEKKITKPLSRDDLAAKKSN